MMPLLTPFSSLQGHWVKVVMIEVLSFDTEGDSDRKSNHNMIFSELAQVNSIYIHLEFRNRGTEFQCT